MQFKNLLITGMPHSGKSTLLEKVLKDIPDKKGFITREIKRNNKRISFEIITSEGQTAVLASKDHKTPIKMSKYFVNIENLDSILTQLQAFNDEELLYVDEIGQMELYSDKFREFVEKCLNSNNLFIGTMTKIYSNDFIKKIRSRIDVKILEMIEGNRTRIYNQVKTWLGKSLKNLKDDS